MNNLEQLIEEKNKLIKEIENYEKNNILLKMIIYALLVVTTMTIFSSLIIKSLIITLIPLIYANISINRIHQKFTKLYDINKIITENELEIKEPSKSKEYIKKEKIIKELYPNDYKIQNLNLILNTKKQIKS